MPHDRLRFWICSCKRIWRCFRWRARRSLITSIISSSTAPATRETQDSPHGGVNIIAWLLLCSFALWKNYILFADSEKLHYMILFLRKIISYVNAVYQHAVIHKHGHRALVLSSADLKIMNFANMSQCAHFVLRWVPYCFCAEISCSFVCRNCQSRKFISSSPAKSCII
jgi:hypothetical protein